jgi:hypothetical protein
MAEAATSTRTLDLIAPGSRVVVRDQDWQGNHSVHRSERAGQGPASLVLFRSRCHRARRSDPW